MRHLQNAYRVGRRRGAGGGLGPGPGAKGAGREGAWPHDLVLSVHRDVGAIVCEQLRVQGALYVFRMRDARGLPLPARRGTAAYPLPSPSHPKTVWIPDTCPLPHPAHTHKWA